MEGGLVFTKYSSGCLRHILLRHSGLRETINPKHLERGAMNEDEFQAGLGTGADVVREKPFHLTVSDSPRTYYSGRIDFLFCPNGPDKKIVELKSTESSSVAKSVIKDGKINSQNLAQTVCYMLAEQCNNAEIIVTYYKSVKKTKVLKKDSERVFKIVIEADGLITVDGENSGYYVRNLLKHAQEAAKVIIDQSVASRPYCASDFDSPCAFCPFRSVCDLYDDGVINSTEEFISVSKQVMSNSSKE